MKPFLISTECARYEESTTSSYEGLATKLSVVSIIINKACTFSRACSSYARPLLRLHLKKEDKFRKEIILSLIVSCFNRSFFVSTESGSRLQLILLELIFFSPTNEGSIFLPIEGSVTSPVSNVTSIRVSTELLVDGWIRNVQGEGSTPLDALPRALKSYLSIFFTLHELYPQPIPPGSSSAESLLARGFSSRPNTFTLWLR